jgi:hypothetical protein
VLLRICWVHGSTGACSVLQSFIRRFSCFAISRAAFYQGSCPISGRETTRTALLRSIGISSTRKSTMKELHDLLDALPYWLLFVLPVFIALSPYNPVCDASELNFPIHRLAQFEISGNR